MILEPYARQLGDSFTDNRGVLEDVLAGFFGIARADGPVNPKELDFLARTARGFRLDGAGWERARGGTSRVQTNEPDPYAELGVARSASDDAVRAAWKQLMRDKPSGQPGLARRAARIHRPRDRQGGADQCRVGPREARARPLSGLRIEDLPSPNCDERPGGEAAIDMLILHYTGMQTAQAAIDRLRDPAAKVSSHYVVDEDGRILRLVPERLRAFHAGISFWRGRRVLNDVCIGIEIVNPGHEWGYRPFPAAQMDAVRALCLEILGRHAIPARNVIGHSDVAPNRKQDPWASFLTGKAWPRQASATGRTGPTTCRPM